MDIFSEEEIEKGVYGNFMKEESRVGYETQFDSFVPMLSDKVTFTRMIDGEWWYVDGIVKEALVKYTFFIMEQLGYIEAKAPLPERATTLLSKGKVVTMSVIKLVVFDIIANSPVVTRYDMNVIDKNKLHSLLINLKGLTKFSEYEKMNFMGDMFIAAVQVILKNIDEYNRRFIDEKLC
jgi:hypothetical protein